MSRKSQPVEKKYKSYELEVLAVTEALEKFRIYLLGRKFKIVTDCVTFTQTMRKREVIRESDVGLRTWKILTTHWNIDRALECIKSQCYYDRNGEWYYSKNEGCAEE